VKYSLWGIEEEYSNYKNMITNNYKNNTNENDINDLNIRKMKNDMSKFREETLR
jgi:hypothetical protein